MQRLKQKREYYPQFPPPHPKQNPHFVQRSNPGTSLL